MNWITKLICSYQRWMDRRILWPACRKHADTREKAEMAFRMHMEMDQAYNDFSPVERDRYIKSLP